MSEEYDPENDTPKIQEFKGRNVIVLQPNSKWSFSFGLAKAKLILAEHNLEAIRKFVESNGKSID
jgi:hypothetical protein